MPTSVCLCCVRSSSYTPHHQPSPCLFVHCPSTCVYNSIFFQASPLLFCSDLWPTLLSFCLLFPPHVLLFLDVSTSQSLPTETSPLFSNGKSISPFVKVALVLSHCLFSLTHSHSHIYSNMPSPISHQHCCENKSLNPKCWKLRKSNSHLFFVLSYYRRKHTVDHSVEMTTRCTQVLQYIPQLTETKDKRTLRKNE